MGFKARSNQSQKLLDLLREHYWENINIKRRNRIHHVEYGYETHINQQAQDALKRIYTTTAKHVRFAPDCVIIQRVSQEEEPVVLVEYKVTTTPKYTLRDRQWDSGQIEADAWDNYLNLNGAGILCAILMYVSYHERPLLCGYPDDGWLTAPRTKVETQTRRGSGTDYCNVDLRKICTFSEFMHSEFQVSKEISGPLVTKVLDAAKGERLLHTNHHEDSLYREGHETGFNWNRTSHSVD